MKTIDNLITELNNIGFNNLHPDIPSRDIKILKNIANLISNAAYITENQGKLLLKILYENLKLLEPICEDLELYIQNPLWNKPFRTQFKIKEVCIEHGKNPDLYITVKFSFDKDLKKVLWTLNKKIGVGGSMTDTKYYLYPLSEKNLITVYDCLEPHKFQFSSDFLELYEKIKNVDTTAITEKFKFHNFIKEKNLMHLELNDDLVKLDQKIRYQYNFDQNFDRNIESTLAYKIANRLYNKVFINSLQNDFTEILKTLELLKRSKILLIFDDFMISECLKHMYTLKNSVEELDLKNIGIYFRFDNKGDGETFNKIISDCKFNSRLDSNSQIVGISNGKIPKFILQNNWYPDTVISFTNSLRNNKTDVYCNECDLIVYYTDVRPLISNVHEIL